MDKPLDLVSRVKYLEERLAEYETVYSASLSPPPGYTITADNGGKVNVREGRAGANFRGKGICSTISFMDALSYCWIHYLGIHQNEHYHRPDGSRILIQWRQLKTGWVWWFSEITYANRDWIASEDFTSIEACVRAAYRVDTAYRVDDEHAWP
jgi:hypothetical protein